MSVFDHIRAEAANFSVQRMCALLGVSRSGYYDHLARQGHPPPPDDERLVTKMRAFQSAANGTYGTRRLHRELMADGERVSRSRVRRLMREHGIVAVQTLLFRKTTDSNHTLGFAPNLLQQNFSTKSVDRVWVGDITYLWTGEGWCYLAVLLDLFSRRVVGWALDAHMRADLPLRALSRALQSRNPQPGLIHHSDRGSQYAAGSYRRLLASWGVAQSMSGAGNCYDNAVAESFFASLKKECTSRGAFATRTEAYDAVARYIDGFYNPTRRHSTLGYVSPVRYEQQAENAA
jgi:putative transposase